LHHDLKNHWIGSKDTNKLLPGINCNNKNKALIHLDYTIRNFITKILVLGIGFLLYLFISRLIGPELFGSFSFISAFVGLIIPLTSMGIGAGLIYYISTKAYRVDTVLYSISIVAFFLSLLNATIIILIYYFDWFYWLNQNLQWNHVLYFAAGTFFQTFSFIIGRVLYGNSDFVMLNYLDLLAAVLNPAMLLLFMFVLGIHNLDFIFISFCLYSAILLMVHGKCVISKFSITSFQNDFFQKSFTYGIKSWTGDLALRANLRLDQILLVSYVSSAALGIYSIAVKLVELIWMIPDAVGPVLFNIIAANKDDRESKYLMARIHRILFYTCLLCMVPWLLLCYYLIVPFILGTAFEQVFLPLIILSPGALFLVSSKIITKLFSASGHVHWTTQITITGAIISIGLYFTLIPLIGMNGAAIASSIGYFSLAMAGLYITISQFNLRIKDLYFVSKNDWSWLLSQYKKWHAGFKMKRRIANER
jgi:O-antigen/teichoic acid export membrane protein